MSLHRRTFLTGLSALIAAPAIVRVSSLMPVKALEPIDSLFSIPPIPPRAVYWEAQQRYFWFHDGTNVIEFSKVMNSDDFNPA